MYIKRNLEEKIVKYLKSPEVIAVVGPRQFGITTMVRKIFEGLKNSVLITIEPVSYFLESGG